MFGCVGYVSEHCSEVCSLYCDVCKDIVVLRVRFVLAAFPITKSFGFTLPAIRNITREDNEPNLKLQFKAIWGFNFETSFDRFEQEGFVLTATGFRALGCNFLTSPAKISKYKILKIEYPDVFVTSSLGGHVHKAVS